MRLKISSTVPASECSTLPYAALWFTAILISSSIVVGMMYLTIPGARYAYDREYCTCDCFDRRFKGEHFDVSHQYRHVYFNITSNTTLLYFWTVIHLALLMAYVNRAVACLCSALGLAKRFSTGRLRVHVLVCSTVNFYGLFYGWWMIFNYINDARHWSDMGTLWPTQLFFHFTDLLPAFVQYELLAAGSKPSENALLASFVVSAAHVFLAFWDQGATNIYNQSPLAVRDSLLFTSDLAGMVAVAPYLKKDSMSLKKVVAGILSFSTIYVVLKNLLGSS